jgi:hypothetical protein
MGLGPPVCENCKVLYEFKHSYGWECPICKLNSPDHLNLWEMSDDVDKLTEQLKANKRFYDFMIKENGGDVSSSNAES